MSFTAKQRAVLRSVRGLRWRIVGEGRVRVLGQSPAWGDNKYEVCPVCAAAAVKTGRVEYTGHAWDANREAGLALRRNEVNTIVGASDDPYDRDRAELLDLIGYTP